MSQVVSVDEKDRDKIEREIEQCQTRFAQVLVPTVLAFGLIAIADPENIRHVTLGCAFAVLFSSSLYFASLSYKIMRNGIFLQVFGREYSGEDKKIYWENALSVYREKSDLPPLIHSETITAGAIYAVLSLTYFFIFYRVNLIASIVATFILLCISFSILWVYKKRRNIRKAWGDLKSDIERASQQKI